MQTRINQELLPSRALQDEISQAIVAALRLKLLPEEKKAIEQRGTANPEAYNFYLMARQYSVNGYVGDGRRSEAIIRLCHRATEIDPNYARAWALLAHEQTTLRLYFGQDREDGLAAAGRAIALDANLAKAHAARARVLTQNARFDEALREIETALRLDSEAYEVNYVAARWYVSMRRIAEAIPSYEKATTVMEADYLAASALVTCYKAIGDAEGARRAARRALTRTEKVVDQQPDHGTALGAGVLTLAALGEVERAKEWAARAMLLDPGNLHLRYNLACTHVQLGEFEAALDLLGPAFEQKVHIEFLNGAKIDPDLDLVRDHPRFKAMLAVAGARLVQS
jgi:adenylate cyclase